MFLIIAHLTWWRTQAGQVEGVGREREKKIGQAPWLVEQPTPNIKHNGWLRVFVRVHNPSHTLVRAREREKERERVQAYRSPNGRTIRGLDCRKELRFRAETPPPLQLLHFPSLPLPFPYALFPSPLPHPPLLLQADVAMGRKRKETIGPISHLIIPLFH